MKLGCANLYNCQQVGSPGMRILVILITVEALLQEGGKWQGRSIVEVIEQRSELRCVGVLRDQL